MKALLLLPGVLILMAVETANAEVTAIVHAHIYAMTTDAEEVVDGTIVIRDGLFESIGPDTVVPNEARIIDAQGRMVTPGLISAASALGLIENAANNHSSDQQVKGAVLGAGFDIQYALNANSSLIRQARADGLTRAVSLPGSSGMAPFNGLGALLHFTNTGTVLEQPRLALFAQLGGPTSESAGGSRAAQWMLLRQALDQARHWQPPAEGEKRALSLADLNSASLNAVIQREIPLLLDVRRESDIRQAIQLRYDFDVSLIILGASEAWRVANALATAEIPVILDPASNLPGTEDEWAVRADAAAILQQAGVLIALYPGSGLHYSLNAGLGAREAAGLAVANGLPYDAALRALTVHTARIWGIEGEAGSIAPGRDADLVIWDGDPLEPASAPALVMVQGVEVSLTTMQTQLRDRYWPRPDEGSWPPAYP